MQFITLKQFFEFFNGAANVASKRKTDRIWRFEFECPALNWSWIW